MKFQLYSSACVANQFDNIDLDIMRTALANNTNYGITGFLYRSRTRYFQYYEGKDEYIDQLTENLRCDRRHFDFQTLKAGNVSARQFAGWSMGYSSFTESPAESNRFRLSESPAEIIKHLLREADRQQESLGRSG